MDYNSGISYADREKTKNIAKKMLKKGMESETIAYITGLAISEIETLKEE